MNHVLDGGSGPPMRRGNFEGKGASQSKVQGYSAVICAKMAEVIEIPFGLWALMVQGIVLDGSPEVLRDVAMATNFGMQFAITGFLAFDGL